MPTRILVVDDNQVFRRAMHKLLVAHDDFHVCGEATNGEEAIQAFRQLKPDCVVLDFSMPLMNGIEAAREILRIDPDAALLLCTMYKFADIEAVAVKTGIDSVISKATENLAKSLVATIEAAVARRYMAKQSKVA